MCPWQAYLVGWCCGLLIVIIASLFDNEPPAFSPEALGIVILTLLTAASVILAWRIRQK